jgi:hypothetical protein
MIDKLFFYLHTMKTNFIFFWIPSYVYKLKDYRNKLEKEVNEFVNSHIKEAEFKQFKDNRIIKEESADENKNNSDNEDDSEIKEEINKFFGRYDINY